LQHLANSAEVRRKLQEREQVALLHRRERGQTSDIIGDDDVLYSSGGLLHDL
jgi:hypothetical protein